MKHFLLICFFVFSIIIARAQPTEEKNLAFIEAGGNGLFQSLNYERQLTKRPGLGIRAGLGIYHARPFDLTIPVGLTYLIYIKKKKIYLEAGFGITYSKADVQLYLTVDRKEPGYEHTHYLNYIPSFGVRRVFGTNFILRIVATPVFNEYEGLPFVGISFGKLF